VLGRLLRRTALPLLAERKARFRLAVVGHLLLLLAELALTFVLASELWCVEPAAEAGGSQSLLGLLGGGGPPVPPPPVDDDDGAMPTEVTCDYVPVALYLAFPPGASILPPLFCLGALASQSARGLRLYAAWNGASIWSTAVALALVAVNVRVLGLPLLAYPVGLLCLKVLSAQCVPPQLAHIESARPIRGWRGLFEVRNGPVERTHRVTAAKAAS